MGLTINYSLSYRGKSETRPKALVEQMRQLALDLPFRSVGEIIDLSGSATDFEQYDPEDDVRWQLIQAQRSVQCPWNEHYSRRVSPTRIIGFSIDVGLGSEPVNLGLCQYPKTIEWEYSPAEDQKFLIDEKRGGYTRFNAYFNYDKFKRHCRALEKKRGERVFRSPDFHKEMRTVKTGRAGWSWGSFCKTQYASEPEAGGMPNFVRCHVSAITLLEKIGQFPGITVEIDDEGHYGPSVYSDDWREANAAGIAPTYVWHPGTYNVKTLCEQCGEYNEFVAAMAGALKDGAGKVGLSLDAPIFGFSNFENLEFKGDKAMQLVWGLAKQAQA